MNEYDLIRRVAALLPRHREQQNGLFECDAELVTIGGETWGMTLDEFTPEEDLFTSDDPGRLGWNLAAATLTDLFAAGVTPRFFLNAMAVPAADPAFAEGLARGVADALRAVGCGHCGGDLGAAGTWRFTGFAMGPVAAPRALTHLVPAEPQILYVTGTVGDLNAAAFGGLPTPRIELRWDLVREMWTCASSCIDTSGGLMDALWILHERNPALRFEVDRALIPWAAAVLEGATARGLPREAALLGGAGEYELLFTVPASAAPEARAALAAGGATAIGTARADGEPGIVLRDPAGSEVRVRRPPPCPREAASVEAHAAEVIRMARELAPG